MLLRRPGSFAAALLSLTCLLAAPTAVGETSATLAGPVTQEKVLLWGDTHLHTSFSFDAFLSGNMTTGPDTAYRFARGLPVVHPYTGARVQLETPLDFLVVTDHAEFYGGMKDIYFNGVNDPEAGFLRRLAYWWVVRDIRAAVDEGEGPSYFADQLPKPGDPRVAASGWTEATAEQVSIPGTDRSATNAWNSLRDAAEANHRPGTFSALLGWEWSSNPGGANLHRIVMTDATPSVAANFMPFGSDQSPYPEDLWRWLAATEAANDARFLAIPHNSNISKGLMFGRDSLRGEPIDAAYAAERLRWEPVVEITQIKGDSETSPTFSPEDEFAGFEPYPYYHQQGGTKNYVEQAGDFVRPALKLGLSFEAELGANPFQFGLIGATDSHTSLATAEEPNFWGKMAADSIPSRKQQYALGVGPTGWTMQAGGLAAVWADENSRAAILDAFARREVYATTGPRIRLRFEVEAGNERVPMGSKLVAGDAAPTFVVQAEKDPLSGNLDRIQIVKGWLDEDGNSQEAVLDLAWSGEREREDGLLPPVGNTVDLATGSYENSIGAATLSTRWQDPDYDPMRYAFYYVRVLEIPTPRHSLLDALALGLEAPTEGPSVIQERAYSSPIWFIPATR